jgi:tripartite-type tricarboxylate transporter receptor subunit TctC
MITRRALLATSLTPFIAKAQSPYPNKPIKLIVPYAAGGGTDAIARLVAQAVSEVLGQTLVVENIGAAGGNVASGQAAKSDPDGYTILMANQGPMTVNPALFKTMPVNPATAFDAVTLIADTPLVLITPKDSPHKTIKSLIDFAKANPEKMNYASAGNGSASHLAAEIFLKNIGAKVLHVPYRGAGPALNDVIGGRSDFMITTIPSVQGQLDGGLVNGLAVTTKTRSPRYPEISTIAENGFPAFNARTWYGFVVPAGTPATIIETLRDATIKAINSPNLKARLANEGANIIGSSPLEFKELMAKETLEFAIIIKDLGLSL